MFSFLRAVFFLVQLGLLASLAVFRALRGFLAFWRFRFFGFFVLVSRLLVIHSLAFYFFFPADVFFLVFFLFWRFMGVLCGTLCGALCEALRGTLRMGFCEEGQKHSWGRNNNTLLGKKK